MSKNRLIALILSVFSVLMLFLPWIIPIGEMGKELRDGIKEAKQYMSIEDIQDEIMDLFGNIGEYTYYADVANKRVKQIAGPLIDDGMLSASELSTFSRGISGLLGSVKTVYKDWDEPVPPALIISQGICLLYQVIFWLAFLSGLAVIALRLLKKDQRSIDIAHFVLQLCVFAFILAVCIIGTVKSADAIGYLDSGDLILCITIFSVLGVVFSLPSSLLSKVPFMPEDKVQIKSNGINWSASRRWLCVCGNSNAYEEKYCPRCGRPKPLPRTCPNCGTEAPQNGDFCGRCGSKLR